MGATVLSMLTVTIFSADAHESPNSVTDNRTNLESTKLDLDCYSFPGVDLPTWSWKEDICSSENCTDAGGILTATCDSCQCQRHGKWRCDELLVATMLWGCVSTIKKRFSFSFIGSVQYFTRARNGKDSIANLSSLSSFSLIWKFTLARSSCTYISTQWRLFPRIVHRGSFCFSGWLLGRILSLVSMLQRR